MNRTLIFWSIAFSSLGAYIVAKEMGVSTAGTDLAADATLPQVPFLPVPQEIARQARERFEKLPTSLWSEDSQLKPAVVDPLPSTFVSTETSQAIPKEPPAKPAEVLAAEAPSAEEVARQLSQSIVAIKLVEGRVGVVLVDRTSSVRRSLTVGEFYQAGWKIAKIQTSTIILVKNRKTVSVPIRFSPESRSVTINALVPLGSFTPTTSKTANPSSTAAKPRRRVARPDTSRD